MSTTHIPGGTVHRLPRDLRAKLEVSRTALSTWTSITPLARNEWICWIQSVQKAETRKKHLGRAIEELKEGKRRPCCWMGCTHRKDKAISPSQAFVLKRKG